jgi:hypothetical protein
MLFLVPEPPGDVPLRAPFLHAHVLRGPETLKIRVQHDSMEQFDLMMPPT